MRRGGHFGLRVHPRLCILRTGGRGPARRTLAPYFERPVRLLEQQRQNSLLEADPSVNTSNQRRWRWLVGAIGSPVLRAIFDPDNCLYRP